MKHKNIVGLLLVLIPLFALSVQIPGAHASGTLDVGPPSIVPQALNTTFDVTIGVSGMDAFNAWDIQVSANQSVIRAENLSITGNIFGSTPITELAHCVNGQGGQGLCDSGDVEGIVHSAADAQTLVSGDGLLFTITYKVVGLGYSNIHLQNDRIANGQTASLVSHLTKDAVYGTPPLTPDFLVTPPNQTSFAMTQGQSRNSTIRLDSSNGFSGNVKLNFTTAIGGSTVQVTGLKVSFNTSTVFVSARASSFIGVEIFTNSSTPATQIAISILAYSGSLFHSLDLTVSISPPGDFVINAQPGLLNLHARDQGNSTISISSNHQFSGQVQLTAQVITLTGPHDANATASLSLTSLEVTPDLIPTSTLTVKTPFSSLPFNYIVRVTATSGSLAPFIDVVVRPPSPDFNFTVTPGSLSTHAGSSAIFNIKLVSTDYFQNTVFLYASALSGTKLSFTPANLALKGLEVYEETLYATLNVTTDPTLSIGAHPLFLTASASDSRSTIIHTLTVEVTIAQEANAPPPVQAASKNVFGLDPLVYFGIVGAVAVALAAVTVLEVRRGRRAVSTLRKRMGSTQISQSTSSKLTGFQRQTIFSF